MFLLNVGRPHNDDKINDMGLRVLLARALTHTHTHTTWFFWVSLFVCIKLMIVVFQIQLLADLNLRKTPQLLELVEENNVS